MKDFIRRFENARLAIQQIRAGEWVPRRNMISHKHLTAHRGNLELWIGNGAWFCEISGPEGDEYFDLLWRHWVWWAPARHLRRTTTPTLK